MINYTCQYRDGEFIPKKLSPSHLIKNPPKYCSRKCRDDAQKRRVVVVCSNPNCKKLKEKALWKLKEHLGPSKHAQMSGFGDLGLMLVKIMPHGVEN